VTASVSIGLDLAKQVFQLHGVDGDGKVMLRRQLKRRQAMPFFSKLPACLIGMEACGTAHCWRTLQAMGHQVRLIPPIYAKAYVRRDKTDPADAEAIGEAVSRPLMRFVPIKSEADPAMAAVHRACERLIAQRTQTINMLRGQMAEFGKVVANGPQHVKELTAELAEPQSVPAPLRRVLLGLVRLLAALKDQITALDKQILAWHQATRRASAGKDRRLWPDPVECRGAARLRDSPDPWPYWPLSVRVALDRAAGRPASADRPDGRTAPRQRLP
jgi:transposase